MTSIQKNARIEKPQLEIVGQEAVFSEDYAAQLFGVDVAIRRGYASDGATLPKWLHWLCGKPLAKPRLYAAAIHDWLYDNHVCTRAKSDEIYLNLCLEWGVFPLDAAIQWVFIRMFGGSHWN